MTNNIFADIYLRILSLIETIFGIFGADASVVKGLIADFEEAMAKQETTENV